MQNLVNNTFFNYLVAMAATWIAAYFGWDQLGTRDLLEIAVQIGIQVVGFIAALRGVLEARKDRVSIAGRRVELKELPPIVQQEVITSMERVRPKRRTLLDFLGI